MAEKTPTLAELIAKAYELLLPMPEMLTLISRHRPDTTIDEIRAALQSRLDEITRERAIRDQWYEAEFGCAPPSSVEQSTSATVRTLSKADDVLASGTWLTPKDAARGCKLAIRFCCTGRNFTIG